MFTGVGSEDPTCQLCLNIHIGLLSAQSRIPTLNAFFEDLVPYRLTRVGHGGLDNIPFGSDARFTDLI